MEPDPKEVLMHLQELGYHVTPQRLEEFIKDLKKLINHELKKKSSVGRRRPECNDDSASSTLPNTTDESVSPSPPPRVSQHSRHKPYLSASETKCPQAASYSSSSECSLSPSRRVLRECTKLTTQDSQEKLGIFKEKYVEGNRISGKPSKTCDCAWRRLSCKCCEENYNREQHSVKSTKSKENLAPARPKSSFIRTWQMTGQPRPGSASQRSDPVSLYHQYQQLWKQQKLPGENNHNDLRWAIRERMLGQEPHPRSCSCNCQSCPCKLNEKDFSKDPKRVSSKILPRGPFHIHGQIKGPILCGTNGQVIESERELHGVFELSSYSDFISKKEPFVNKPTVVKENNATSGRKLRGTWLSKEEIEKANQICSEINDGSPKVKQTLPPIEEEILNVSEVELQNHRLNHDKAACKYCGLIHYILNSDRPNPERSENSINNSKTSYWPQQFTVAADVHRADESTAMSPISTSSRPTATSTPVSDKGKAGSRYRNSPRSDHRLSVQGVSSRLILATATRSSKCKENSRNAKQHYEATVPINSDDFKGEVKTEIEIFQRRIEHFRQQPTQNNSNLDPLFIVNTQLKVHKM